MIAVNNVFNYGKIVFNKHSILLLKFLNDFVVALQLLLMLFYLLNMLVMRLLCSLEAVIQIKEHEEKLNRDYKIIQELQEQNKLLIENDLAVIEHIIGGNHVDRLKDRRDRIQSYLIEKS